MEVVDTLKGMYQFYAYTPDRELPAPQLMDVLVLASSTE